jgi:ABC-type multidrug transport system fused ATPase/permease subunit
MMKSGEMWNQGLPLLILYNLCFVVPLVAVFGLTWAGLRFAQLMNWSIRNVVISKILLGLLFLGMAGLMLVVM